MREVIQYATTEDLNQLLETLADCESVTEDRANLFYAVVDELQKRGDLQKTPEKEIEGFVRELKRKSAATHAAAGVPDEQDHPLMKHLPRIFEDEKRDRAERRQRRMTFLRLPIAAASMIVILLLTNAVALANGYDFLGSISRWTKGAVYFVFGGDSAEKPTQGTTKHYDRLKITLEGVGIAVDLPKYIPEGFVFDSIEPDEPDEFSNIVAWFVSGDDYFSISLKRIAGASKARFNETDGEEHAEIYSKDNGQFMVTTNKSRVVAIWYQGIYEISIQGSITYEQLTQMLDSI